MPIRPITVSRDVFSRDRESCTLQTYRTGRRRGRAPGLPFRSRVASRANTVNRRRVPDGHPATDGRTSSDVVDRAKRPLVAGERVPGGHAAAHAAFRRVRDVHRRHPVTDEPVRRDEDRMDARRWHHLGDSRVRVFQGRPDHRVGQRVHDPRKQLHAVDRDGRGLHDLATHRQPGGLHDDHPQGRADHDHDRLDDLDRDSGRPVRLSTQTPLHQRRAARLPRGSSGRRRHGRAAQQ